MKIQQGLAFLLLLGFVFPSLAQQYQKLPPQVNMATSQQSNPAVSPDGQWLAFTSDRSGMEKLYISERQNGNWQNPRPVDAVNAMFGQALEIDGTCFNYNSSRIYFASYPQGKPAQSDIYYVQKQGSRWQEPQKLPEIINSDAYEGMPSITIDNNKLFFTRDEATVDERDWKDKQCKTLYFAQKGKDGQWKQARNLPSPVNGGCDNSPFILSDNYTLLLSSIRPPKENDAGEVVKERYGGYDLYQSKNLAQRIWSSPSMLDAGKPLDEWHFSATAMHKEAYVAMSMVDDNEPKSQIYRLDLEQAQIGRPVMVMKGNITNLNDETGVQATIDVIRKSTSQVITSYQSRPDGSYYFILPSGEDYMLDITRDNFSHTFLEYDLQKMQEHRVVNKDLQLYGKVSLQLNVFDREIYEPLEGKISVYEKKGMKPLDIQAEMTAPGRFILDLPIGKEYTIQANKKHYNPFAIHLDVTGVVQFDQFKRDMELKPRKRKMEIEVSDEATAENLAVDIIITNLDKNERIVKTAEKNADGKYAVDLREGDAYEIDVKSPKGYAYYNKNVDMDKAMENRKLDAELKPLKAETKLQLKNITFETNSAELNASSFQELERVIELLNNNANIRIEISAHTDDVGSESYNEKLSQSRAQSVVDYLRDNGVTSDQLVSKGYGESRPLVPNNSDENRAKNRRVEIEILEVLEDGTVKQRAESKANIENQEK